MNGTILTALEVAGTNATYVRGGYTLFAPDNSALQSINETLFGLIQTNTSAARNLIVNHIIIGSTVYSTQLLNATTNSSNSNNSNSTTEEYYSAAGEPLRFSSNDTGLFVTPAGNSSAPAVKIVRSDVLVNNGVVHVIDGVLFVLEQNEEVASSV